MSATITSFKFMGALALMFTLSACQQEPMVTLAQHAQLQSQVNTLSSRLTQLEQQQQSIRQRIEEVAKARLMPTGVSTQRQNQSAFDAGESAYQVGNTDEALAAFEAYLAKNPNGERALLARYFVGDIYYMRHNYDYAARYFGDFLQKAPQHSRAKPALEKLVKALEALGRTEDAKVLQEKGLQALQP